MSATILSPARGTPSPVLPMSWLDWSQDADEYAGGEYRIRLVEPYRWEVLHRGAHLRFDTRLSSALAQAEHHFGERLRAHDLVGWGLILLGSVAAIALMDATVGLTRLWSIPVLCVLLYVGLSAMARLFAAASRDRYNPYRRRAPREPRNWWQQ